jgi:hypothetical protein
MSLIETHLPAFLLFASDATLFAVAAAGVLAISVLAFWRDRRRRQRREPDAVGLLPWRDIAALSSIAGLVMLAVAVMGWIRG